MGTAGGVGSGGAGIGAGILAERAFELIDGLMLGGAVAAGGRLALSRPLRYAGWVQSVAAELRRYGLEAQLTPRRGSLRLVSGVVPTLSLRWVRKAVPVDVRLTPLTLTHWFAGAGTVTSGGYSLRFNTHGFAEAGVRMLAARLAELYGWRPTVFTDRGYWCLRLSRSGDRLALRRMVVGGLPACFQSKLLGVRESASCSEVEAERRRLPWVVDEARASAIYQRVVAGEPYAAVAAAFEVSVGLVGQIARGRRWQAAAEQGGIRKRRPNVALSKEALLDIALGLARGETQAQVAARHGIAQGRVSWLASHGKLPRVRQSPA